MSHPVSIGVIGLGRIGRRHLENLHVRIPEAKVLAAASPSASSREHAEALNIPLITADPEEIFSHPEIQAVCICSSTDTHTEFIERAAKAGKHIFCEKPLDLDIGVVERTLEGVNRAGVQLMVAFNQRIDPDMQAAVNQVHQGKVGQVHHVSIISRDPAPPPLSFIRTSGGMLMDMTIHDLDMARFIMQGDPVSVFARGANLVDPEIGAAGDIDTAWVMLSYENGAQVQIHNSRKSAYGYDQRLEVFGFKGMVQVENGRLKRLKSYDQEGGHEGRLMDFFLDRYAQSYVEEMRAFVHALQHHQPVPISGEDGLKAMRLAAAAQSSLNTQQPVAFSSS